MKPYIITLAAFSLAGGMQPFCIQAQQKNKPLRPNILFILSDDHTSQSWGIYGGILDDYVVNENIKRLAEEGCVLDNCFCTNSISVPSRASILTGAYSHVNSVYTLSDALDPEEDTFVKHMQADGYQTAIFGKWHLKTEPQGFDYYSVFYEQGTYRNPTFYSTGDKWYEFGDNGNKVQGFSTDIVTDKTIRWIKETDPDKPFLVCCHFKATHEPWDYPERFEHIFDDVVFPEPDNLYDFDMANGRSFHGQNLEILGSRWRQASINPKRGFFPYPGLPFSTEGLDSIKARHAIYQKFVKDYLRCGAAIDNNIGRLLDTIDEMGISDNTIVIYVGDQGYFLGEHGMFDKRMMYEEPLKMPFVIRYPAEIPAGTRRGEIILNIDFASLLSDYAGIEVPAKSQGRSFRKILSGKKVNGWRKAMYYRYWTHHEVRPAHYGIRNDRYKLLFLYGDPLDMTGSEKTPAKPAWEFYDLKNDPHENHNAYSDPRYRRIIKRMKKELVSLKSQYGDQDTRYPRMQEILKQSWQ